MDRQVIISIKTIAITLGALLAGYIVYRLGPVIVVLVTSLFLVIAVEGAVKYLCTKTLLNKPVSRGVAVLVTYALFILAVLVIFTLGLPPIVVESQKLVASLTQILQDFSERSDLDISSTFLPKFTDVTGGVLSATSSILAAIMGILSVVIFSIYMSLDWVNLKAGFLRFFPEKIKGKVSKTIQNIETNVGHWVKGQLLLMLIVGTVTFFGLLVLGVRYPLILGLIAGILEIVPIIGPIITAVLAAVIAFADSPIKGFGVLALFIIIQQLENNLLVPKIMGKVSGFSPLIILLALLVGSNFFGIIGAILAVPTTMVLSILAKRFLNFPSSD